MLLVQQFLETHTFKELQEQHGVYASFSKSGHKFSLNYDQLEARESDPLSQECRGLILAANDGHTIVPEALNGRSPAQFVDVCPGGTVILAYPMKRFFNYGQGSAAEIDWHDPNLAVLEKLDGTLCIVYFDHFIDKWCVATRSVSEADLLMDNGIFTFRTLFEKALQDTVNLSFDDYTAKLEKYITYCFELTTPYNRIVVNYPNNRITLLAARSLACNHEYDISDFNKSIACGVPVVQAHAYTSIQELVDWISSLNPMEHEGVVIRDSNFNRIKVKNAAYVAYNKVRDALGTSERNCVELILTEKDDDVIPMLPEEIVKNLQKIKSGIQTIIKQHDEAYLAIKAEADSLKPGDKKTFAVLTTVTYKYLNLWTAPMFQMFDGKSSNMKDFIMKSRNKDGGWGSSFLDKILELCK